MKTCPYCRRSFDDRTYDFCLEDGSPLAIFEEPEVETVISFKKFKIQSSPRLNDKTAIIDEPTIAFNISRHYQSARNSDELYEITRGFWRIFRNRADKAKYAFAIFQGEIKEVYEIHRWEAGGGELSEFWIKRKREYGEEIDPTVNNGRFQFVGQIAPKHIQEKYVGKQLPATKDKFPVRYFNC